jgi:predicted transcriptional regulator
MTNEMIQKARVEAGLTQAQLAKRARLSADYIFRIEAGLVPSDSALDEIKDALAVALADKATAAARMRTKIMQAA